MGKHAKEWNVHYLNQQIYAMRWLAYQGLTPHDIRVMRWGSVDETTKTITIKSKVFFIKYDRKTGVFSRVEDYKEIKIDIPDDRELRYFFLKSKYICPWMFTQFPPKTWRREQSKSSLFPLEAVEKYCQELSSVEATSVLTELNKFANIEVSKLNITKTKTREPIREAEVIKS